ncbi:hypothetical protein LCGC14_2764730, partial [marine sediment metagenome]
HTGTLDKEVPPEVVRRSDRVRPERSIGPGREPHLHGARRLVIDDAETWCCRLDAQAPVVLIGTGPHAPDEIVHASTPPLRGLPEPRRASGPCLPQQSTRPIDIRHRRASK